MNKENRSRIIRVVVGIAIILAALGTSIAMRLPDRLANKDDTPIKLEETVTKEAEPVQTKTEEPVMSLSTEKKNKEKQEIKQEENNTEPEAKPEFVLPIEGKVSIETYNDLPPLPEIEINLCAIGDIMAHDGTIASARRGNTYDFTAMLQEVSPYMADADYIVGNLETTFAGASKGYTGYPLFNTPEQMANGLRNVLGMDLLSTANNHSLDKGYDGLVSTLKFLEEYGIDHVGTYRSKDEQNTPFITEINGVKVAFLSYTYASNQPIPSKRGYCINIIDKSRIKDEAARAKEAGAEYIIVLLHWGVEYQRYASKSQRYLSEWIFENTYTDLIIGNHAHVVAPIEEFNVEFDGRDKKGIVFYALGNFTCSQTKDYRNSGIIANIKLLINKEDPTKNRVDSISYTPTYIDPNDLLTGKRYRVVPLNKAIADYEAGIDPLITKAEYNLISMYKKDYKEMLEIYPYIHENEEILSLD